MAKQIRYKIGSPTDFSKAEIDVFLKLLIKQNKVQQPSCDRLWRCKLLAIAMDGSEVIAIGAIKPKTASDFQAHKADKVELSNQFQWEIGYFFTEPAYEGQKISSGILDRLLTAFGARSLMATTEKRDENRMINLLENRGFVKAGKTWKSIMSGKSLQLFIKIHKA